MSKGSFGIGVVMGALTGAAAAYLFAPQSGNEFKEEVTKKSNEAKKKAVLALDEAVTEAEIWLDNKNTEHNMQNEPVAHEHSAETITTPPRETAIDEAKNPDGPL